MTERTFLHRGQRAVVTGAASGIGAALAERLAARGARLVLADVAREPLQHLADRLHAVAIVADVSDPDQVEHLAEAAADARIVCLNAGVMSSEPGAPWEASPAEWDRVLGVNLGGVVNGLRSFVPRLLYAGHPAHILVTASLAGLATWPSGGPYAASKHAVVAVAEQAELTLAETNVRVSVACPALVRTAMSDVGDDPLEVAEEALTAMIGGRFAFVPEMWRCAVRDRGFRLGDGLPPVLPEPDFT
jgi:NAD(P)-dependent dehydrogenase (short-subunit alcohol dehydrogenase family)